jgi:hypothetical protein
MKQKTISPRIDSSTHEFLAETFSSPTAGGGYIIEAFTAVYRRYVSVIKTTFTPAELMLMIDVSNGTALSPQVAGQNMALSVADAIKYDSLDEKWEVDGRELLLKLDRLSLPEASILEVWTRGFWEQHPKQSLEDYIK